MNRLLSPAELFQIALHTGYENTTSNHQSQVVARQTGQPQLSVSVLEEETTEEVNNGTRQTIEEWSQSLLKRCPETAITDIPSVVRILMHDPSLPREITPQYGEDRIVGHLNHFTGIHPLTRAIGSSLRTNADGSRPEPISQAERITDQHDLMDQLQTLMELRLTDATRTNTFRQIYFDNMKSLASKYGWRTADASFNPDHGLTYVETTATGEQRSYEDPHDELVTMPDLEEGFRLTLRENALDTHRKYWKPRPDSKSRSKKSPDSQREEAETRLLQEQDEFWKLKVKQWAKEAERLTNKDIQDKLTFHRPQSLAALEEDETTRLINQSNAFSEEEIAKDLAMWEETKKVSQDQYVMPSDHFLKAVHERIAVRERLESKYGQNETARSDSAWRKLLGTAVRSLKFKSRSKRSEGTPATADTSLVSMRAL
ncbi:uncharacterized protein I303_105821 [Kwoniella dejecticola CBS 10117]|uniref:Uncharacterized protein n=1 Tax=Kwoniella dejecticola CBS 10117 TaxID=1296121 RepID=A0A1A6A0J9_9TREE|nr:uncharacterized protein I303_05843 [Kwoniella dejecticola CBS 10117]OBR83563.1 hypothetical protein I303_05843 [Kwoniella dejecticola CBS 10117]